MTVFSPLASVETLIAWNDRCYSDLSPLSATGAANEIADAISPLIPSDAASRAFAKDVYSALIGSAIEVVHTIAGRRVEFELSDNDAIVVVDGVEVARFDWG